MKVTILQYDVKQCKKYNLDYLQKKLKGINTDLIVLPELTLSGYIFKDKISLYKMSTDIEGDIEIEVFKSISLENNCVIVVGVAEKCNNKVYNSALVFARGAYIGKYRKMHLTDYEKNFFERGYRNTIFDLGIYKLGVQICFDSWFPEISREQKLLGADLLCIIGNFGNSTTYDIAHTRAIENCMPVVLCNRVGEEILSDFTAKFLGKSVAIDRNGKNLDCISEYNEGMITIDIDIDKNNKTMLSSTFLSEIMLHYDLKK